MNRFIDLDAIHSQRMQVNRLAAKQRIQARHALHTEAHQQLTTYHAQRLHNTRTEKALRQQFVVNLQKEYQQWQADFQKEQQEETLQRNSKLAQELADMRQSIMDLRLNTRIKLTQYHEKKQEETLQRTAELARELADMRQSIIDLRNQTRTQLVEYQQKQREETLQRNTALAQELAGIRQSITDLRAATRTQLAKQHEFRMNFFQHPEQPKKNTPVDEHPVITRAATDTNHTNIDMGSCSTEQSPSVESLLSAHSQSADSMLSADDSSPDVVTNFFTDTDTNTSRDHNASKGSADSTALHPLTDIRGIGVKTEQMLHKIGIYAYSDLLNHTPKALNKLLHHAVSVHAIKDWMHQAEQKVND